MFLLGGILSTNMWLQSNIDVQGESMLFVVIAHMGLFVRNLFFRDQLESLNYM